MRGAVRLEKLLAVLQAYTDESAAETGDQRLFMAGYVHTAEGWSMFSDLWIGALGLEPPIDYLHMVEANNLRGQFKGWDAARRDAKLSLLASVIEQLKPVSFEFSVDRRAYYANAKGVAPRGLAVPHFAATFHTIAGIAHHVTEDVGLDVPIDFVFDEQCGVSDDIGLFFPSMRKNLPKRSQAVINGDPLFRNDRQVLPLQAADMLAWHVRREHEFGAGPRKTLPMADRLRNPKGHLIGRLDEPMLAEWGKFFRKLTEVSTPATTKGEWQRLKRLMRQLQSAGFDLSSDEMDGVLESIIGPNKL